MLVRKRLPKKDFRHYRKFLTASGYQRMLKIGKQLKGKRVFHVNATPTGGGVAEILQSLVPLQRSLGIDARWYSIDAPQRFFLITKKIHDSLQGSGAALSAREKSYYADVNEVFAGDAARLKPDVLVVHDPQPIGTVHCCDNIPTILRIHPDLSSPNKETIKFLLPYFKKYSAVIFSMKEYVPKALNKHKVFIVSPAIDPLHPKHRPLGKKQMEKTLKLFGIHPKRPLIAQISRFDLWKDPIGVIQAFWEAEKHVPGLQLALVGVLQAQDDPTAVKIFQEVKRCVANDPNIFLILTLNHIPVSNNLAVNVFQRAADVILQKSLKEGFGLTVTEAMWKKRVVIGGNVGGIKDQIVHGRNGYLVESPEEAAARIVEIFTTPKTACIMGRRARETVQKKFLLPRLLEDHLKIYRRVLQ